MIIWIEAHYPASQHFRTPPALPSPYLCAHLHTCALWRIKVHPNGEALLCLTDKIQSRQKPSLTVAAVWQPFFSSNEANTADTFNASAGRIMHLQSKSSFCVSNVAGVKLCILFLVNGRDKAVLLG